MRGSPLAAGFALALALALGACDAEKPKLPRGRFGAPPSMRAAPTPAAAAVDRIATGTFHYRVLDARRGRDAGSAKLEVSRTEQRGLEARLTLALQGAAVRSDERRMVLDADGGLVSATWTRDGVRAAHGVFATGIWCVTSGEGASAGPLEPVQGVTSDGATSLVFLLAPLVPDETGARLGRTLLADEAMTHPGVAGALVCEGRDVSEIGGDRVACRAVRIEAEGYAARRVLSDDTGRVVRADWTGDLALVLATGAASPPRPGGAAPPAPTSASTSARRTDAAAPVPGGLAVTHEIVIEHDLPDVGPARAFEWFTKSDLVAQWWAPRAEVRGDAGAPFVLTWPEMKWTLRGTVDEAEPGRRLVVTWRWDHARDSAPRRFAVEFTASGPRGTRVKLVQGTYGESPADRRDRIAHRESWLRRLADLAEVAR